MVTKATHEPYKIELFAPVMKSVQGDYIAVLSDNSIDRDDEFVTTTCIERLGNDMGYIAGLIDHDNSVLKMVAEWVNRKVVDIDGHKALVAEPKFFKSNPNAKIIMGMLDEGAKIGISIGAMVKDYDEVDGRRAYKELELVEASFVAVPSNRHGRCMAVAKSFNLNNKKKEDSEMELTQKDIDSAVEKAKTEMSETFKKQLESKDSEIAKLKKEAEDAQSEVDKAKEESKQEKEDADKKLAEAEDKLKAKEEELVKEKKQALEKMNYAKGHTDAQGNPIDAEKAFSEGKLPIMRT
jgi:hypothetical protein